MFYSRNLQTVWKPSCKPFWIILCQTIWHNQRPWICLIAWSCCEDVRLQFKSCTFLPEHTNDFKKRKLQDTWRNLTVKNEQWFQVYIWSLCQMVKLNHMFKESIFFLIWLPVQIISNAFKVFLFACNALHVWTCLDWIWIFVLKNKRLITQGRYPPGGNGIVLACACVGLGDQFLCSDVMVLICLRIVQQVQRDIMRKLLHINLHCIRQLQLHTSHTYSQVTLTLTIRRMMTLRHWQTNDKLWR